MSNPDMLKALRIIESLHQPDEDNACEDCGNDWPCITYNVASKAVKREAPR